MKKRGEDRVFDEVRAFANEELDGGNCRVGNVGGEPAQKRADESRGVLRGQQIGRADENENHPEQDRQPIFENAAHQKQNHRRAACANFAA